MSIDVRTLAEALLIVHTRNNPAEVGTARGDWQRQVAADDAARIAVEYARLVPAEDEGRRFDRSWSHYADDCPVPPSAEDERRLREALARLDSSDPMRWNEVADVIAAARALAATPEPWMDPKG